MSTRKRKHRAAQPAAAAAAAEPPPAAFSPPARTFAHAIRCGYNSELLDVDDECFLDCWKDEITEAEDAAIDSAKAYDGTWLWWGKLPNRPGSIRSGVGKPLLFPTAEAAAETAGQVWVSLLQAVQNPCKPVLERLQQQQEGEEDSSSVQEQLEQRAAAAAAAGGRRRPCKRSKAAVHSSAKQTGSKAEQKAAIAAALAIAAVAVKQVSATGRASWEAWLKWFDDSFGMPPDRPVNSIVRSMIRVGL